MHIEYLCTCPQWLVTHDGSTIYIFDRIKRLYTSLHYISFLATRTFAPQTAWVVSMCPPCSAIWTPRRGCRFVPRMPRTWRVTAVPSAPFAHTNKDSDLKNIGNTNKLKIEWKSRLQGSLTRSSGILKIHLPPPPKNWKTEGFWAGLQCWRNLQGPSPVLNRPFLEASNLQLSHDVSRCLILGFSAINRKPLIKLSNYQLSKVYPSFIPGFPTKIQQGSNEWLIAGTWQPASRYSSHSSQISRRGSLGGKMYNKPRWWGRTNPFEKDAQLGSFPRWKLKKNVWNHHLE